MKFIILFLVILVVFGVSIALGASNDQIVVYNYLLAQTEIRLSTLTAILVLIGFILGWLITGFFFVKIRIKLTATQMKLKKVQKLYDEESARHKQTQLTSLPPNNVN